jgi:hypothetical protein
MNKEMIEWYSDRHYNLKKVLKAGRRRGLHPYFIREAMKHCYQKVQDGKDVHDIQIGRYIFNKAKDIREEGRDARFMDEENYTLKIKGLIYPAYGIILLALVTFLSYKIWWC